MILTSSEQLAEAIGQLIAGGILMNIFMIAIGVFLAIIMVKILIWIVKLPFKLLRMIFVNESSTQKTDYGYNTVYDTNDKWEYNERKQRWEPKDKSRIIENQIPSRKFRSDGRYWDKQKGKWIEPDYK